MKRLACRPAAVMLIAGIMLLSAAAYAGEPVSQTRDVSGFDRIEIKGVFDLYLTQGKDFNLRIEAEQDVLEKIISEVKDGRLILSEKENKIKIGVLRPKTRKAYITFPELKELCIKGAADVNGQNAIKAGDFRLIISGAGNVNMTLDATDLEAMVSGAGDIRLKGAAENTTISITGAGDIEGFDLSSQKATVSISGAGDCKLSVEKELAVNITGIGNMSYRGNPKMMSKNVTGMGHISKD